MKRYKFRSVVSLFEFRAIQGVQALCQKFAESTPISLVWPIVSPLMVFFKARCRNTNSQQWMVIVKTQFLHPIHE